MFKIWRILTINAQANKIPMVNKIAIQVRDALFILSVTRLKLKEGFNAIRSFDKLSCQ